MTRSDFIRNSNNKERDNKMRNFKGCSKSRRAATALGMPTGLVSETQAFKNEAPNLDIGLRWDNAVEYDVGVRAESRDSRISNNPFCDNSEMKLDRGDAVSNRVDQLSEFDLIHKKNHGLRAILPDEGHRITMSKLMAVLVPLAWPTIPVPVSSKS